MMKRKSRFFIIVILGLLSAIGPFSIDMYLPGFPAIATELSTTVAHVSLSLSSFFIGISAGQLLYGPLLDRFGRIKPLKIGLLVYLITSIGCAFATSADGLIVLRLLQAVGGCAGMVASRAMVRDMFPVQESAKVFSMLMLVVGVSPIIAPTLGGYITASLGWRYIFAALTILATGILLAVHFGLKETRPANTEMSLKPKPILTGFLSVLVQPSFYVYALTGSIASAGLYAYITGSPYVFMEIFRVTEKQYGWIFAVIAAGLIGSSQLNTVLLRKYQSEQIIKVALLCQSTTGILLFVGSYFHLLTIYPTIILIFLFLCCQGFTFPNTSALSLAPFSKNAGSASALLGAIQMGIGALTSALVSLLSNHTALPMTGVMAACAIVSFTLQQFGGSSIMKKSGSLIREKEETIDMISKS